MEKIKTLNLQAFAWASLVPVTVMIAAMWMKPLWRDELFSLYYADPEQSLGFLMRERWSIDAHPPLYNPLLWAWSFISEHPFWQKCLSLLFAGLGALLSFRLIASEQKRHLYVFLLMCLGSYWVIYFATEIRPYILNFTLSALLSLCALRLMSVPRPSLFLWISWLVLGMALSLTHFFGALWFAALGFVTGVYFLFQNQKKSFFIIGMLSVLGLIPVMFWIKFALGHMEFSGVVTDASLLNKFQAGLHQFLRGLVIKTFGSNPLITFLGIGGIWLGLRGANKAHRVLIIAMFLTVTIAFILHVSFVDMIKERAFIVIMPAILWIMAGHLSDTSHLLARYVPWVTAIMPFLFVSEYFKNKEEFPQLAKVLNAYEECETTDLYVFYRQGQPQAFHAFAAEYILNPNEKRRLINIDGPEVAETGRCPYIAATILQPKGGEKAAQYVKETLNEKGYVVSPMSLGQGRTIIWLDSSKAHLFTPPNID